MGQIRTLTITVNDNTGEINCNNDGNFTDNELVGMFETLKTLYLHHILKTRSAYYPNFQFSKDDFDTEIKER